MEQRPLIAKVALSIPVHKEFDFIIPDLLQSVATIGKRAKVPLRNRERWGVIIAITEESRVSSDLEALITVADDPSYTVADVEFCRWMSDRYLAPLGIVINRPLPQRVTESVKRYYQSTVGVTEAALVIDKLKRRAPRQAALLQVISTISTSMISEAELSGQLGEVRRQLIRLREEGLIKEVQPTTQTRESLPILSIDETAAVKQICAKFTQGGRVLLHGRDRRGIYHHVVAEAIKRGESALILVPERLLLSQIFHSFRTQWGEIVEIYHGGLSEGERGRIWNRVRSGDCLIIVGTRSAIFLPFTNLRLIIIDEEQDSSYKQQDMLPYYHAREATFMKGEITRKHRQAPLLLLGSVAPSVETFHATHTEEIELIRLKQQARKSDVEIKVIDLRRVRKSDLCISPQLRQAITATLSHGKKVLLIVNRRGYFPVVLCKECGQSLRCPQCGINLVYHFTTSQLLCHLCSTVYHQMRCSQCHSRALRFLGVGTQRVEAEINRLFPAAATIRIDTDTMRKKKEQLSFTRRDSDIVIGTPMVAKGSQWTQLGLVGVVSADTFLGRPDFRAAERTFQLLANSVSQIESGRIIIQTYFPDQYAIRYFALDDYDGFYHEEIDYRKQFFYPPFSYLAKIILRDNDQQQKKIEMIKKILAPFPVDLLGPTKTPGVKKEEKYLLVKGATSTSVCEATTALLHAISELRIDIDPL
ncbi:primosomal protein N' [Candidatus Acetothermia bacterium]|nr:primosomal protein N' [Candidatus Acetothermia bacterium]MCI2427393.1 primosomal protein N' [Candidatus Acetothermia bacterium]MCI2428780.1 primosomal protein N' [Candidatus Acetothermia bacterium]